MTEVEFIRRNADLSQVEVGQRIGIHPTAITQIERGHRKAWPKLQRQLAEVLQVPIKLLFHEDGTLKEKVG